MDQPNGSPGTEVGIHRLDGLRRGIRRSSLFAAGIAAALLAVALYGTLVPGPQPLTAEDVRTGVEQALASMTPPPARSQLVYEVIRPSLVLVETDRRLDAFPSASPDADGLGTGVVVDQQGDILTSLHVVEGATSIRVTFADGTTSAARVTGSDPENDIAVLVADELPSTLVPATLGNPNAVQVGSEAYVVGNPFGLYSSISAGVVSGLDRTLEVGESGRVLRGLIQVDAAVNPGNSGGPLLNRNGQVVGIVAALLNPTRDEVFVGIGLAVRIDVAGGPAGLPPY